MRQLLVAAALLTSTVIATPAFAAILKYDAVLDGASESPPVSSTGSGTALVTYDSDAHTLTVEIAFKDLVGTTTVAHIHCCTATPFVGVIGVATPTPTFPGFPAGVIAGTYTMTFDLTDAGSFNPAFVTAQGSVEAAEAALAQGFAEGRAYVNIHSSFAPGGEIRGFLNEVRDVPEPGMVGLLGLGCLALGLARRRKR